MKTGNKRRDMITMVITSRDVENLPTPFDENHPMTRKAPSCHVHIELVRTRH